MRHDPSVDAYFRRARLADLLRRSQIVESELCDLVAQIVELTEAGDELHIAMRQLLEALER